MTFLLNSQNKGEEEFTFSHKLINGKHASGKITSCLGDLGCAMSIYTFGAVFKKPEITALAIELFRKHSNKRDVEKYGIQNPDFCNGSIGIAHFYARMFNNTGLEEFRETAEFWYKITLHKAFFEDGLAGYKHYNRTLGFHQNYGLLEGISGIGLSFISAISTIAPKWDSCLLMS